MTRPHTPIPRPLPLVLALALAGCAQMPAALGGAQAPPDAEAAAEAPAPEDVEAIVADADAAEAVVAAAGQSQALPADRRTAEDFDTTTEAERQVAVAAAEAPPETPERSLGSTVASLGDATQPGLWLETPLVSAATPGRLAYGARGTSVLVELRPSGGAAGSGSRISLAAMRLLEAPLTDLPTLQVFAR